MSGYSFDSGDGTGAGTEPPSGISILRGAAGFASIWLGTAVAASVAGAVGVWGYQLTERSASDIPVIRAALGPAKTRPEDPGGNDTPNQDIQSFALIAAEERGSAAETLAPPSAKPREEDVAMAALSPPTGEEERQTSPLDIDAVPKPLRRPGAVAEPPPDQETPVLPASTPTEQVPAATDRAPAASPIVRPRPSDIGARIERATRTAAVRRDTLQKAASTSDVQIQLGAFSSQTETLAIWSRVSRQHADVLRGRALAVQQTVSGGTTWYRLRVGPFRDRAEANSVCQALIARGQDCIIASNQQRG
ncbi:MAG: SPOR domain-containing protein [Pseudomonadota bacterium]